MDVVSPHESYGYLSDESDIYSQEEEPIPRFSSETYTEIVTNTREATSPLEYEDEESMMLGGDDWWFDDGNEGTNDQSPVQTDERTVPSQRPLTASNMVAMLTPPDCHGAENKKRSSNVLSNSSKILA